MKAKLAIAGLLLVVATAGFFWYSQQGAKLSDTDTILIANFSNATGEPVLDSSLQEALAISLSQSPSLNLVSVEKVTEALRSLGRPLETVVTRDLAPQLCQRLGATVYLTGSISKDGSGYALKLDATRCSSDDAVARSQSDAAGKGDVVRALGMAAKDLRGKFGEDAASLQKFDLPLDRPPTRPLNPPNPFTQAPPLPRAH